MSILRGLLKKKSLIVCKNNITYYIKQLNCQIDYLIATKNNDLDYDKTLVDKVSMYLKKINNANKLLENNSEPLVADFEKIVNKDCPLDIDVCDFIKSYKVENNQYSSSIDEYLEVLKTKNL